MTWDECNCLLTMFALILILLFTRHCQTLDQHSTKTIIDKANHTARSHYLFACIIYVFSLMVALTQRQDNQTHGWGHEPKCWQLKHTRHLHEWISIILSCHAAPEKLYKTPLHTIKFNLWTETRDEFLASGAKLVA